MFEGGEGKDPEFEAALARLRANRLDEAIDRFSRLVQADPFHFTAAAYLGASYYQKGDIENAARAFESAAEIRSDSANVHYNLGLCYRALGQGERARRSFENALKLKPDYAQAEQALAALGAPDKPAERARCVNHPYIVADFECVSCGKPFCRQCLQLAPPERRPLGADESIDYYICEACLSAPKGPSEQLRKAETQPIPEVKFDARGKYYGQITQAMIEGSTSELAPPRPIAAAPPLPLWRRLVVLLIWLILAGGVVSAIYLIWQAQPGARTPLSYKDPGGAFMIMAPKSWKVVTDTRVEIPGESSVAFAPRSKVFKTEVATLTVDYDVASSLSTFLGSGVPSLDRMREAAVEISKMPGAVGLDPGTALTSERKVKIGGIDALLLEFEGSTLGEPVIEREAWLVAPGGKVCILSFRADKKSYVEYSQSQR
jgi:hypothetical protein